MGASKDPHRVGRSSVEVVRIAEAEVAGGDAPKVEHDGLASQQSMVFRPLQRPVGSVTRKDLH